MKLIIKHIDRDVKDIAPIETETTYFDVLPGNCFVFSSEDITLDELSQYGTCGKFFTTFDFVPFDTTLITIN